MSMSMYRGDVSVCVCVSAQNMRLCVVHVRHLISFPVIQRSCSFSPMPVSNYTHIQDWTFSIIVSVCWALCARILHTT